jgi:hypothetical protein
MWPVTGYIQYDLYLRRTLFFCEQHMPQNHSLLYLAALTIRALYQTSQPTGLFLNFFSLLCAQTGIIVQFLDFVNYTPLSNSFYPSPVKGKDSYCKRQTRK